MNTWRKIRMIVIVVGIFVFSWFANSIVVKSKIPEMKKEIEQLKKVEMVFAHTVSIIPVEQKRTYAKAASKYFDSKISSVDDEIIYKLFCISQSEEKAESKKTGEEITEKKGG